MTWTHTAQISCDESLLYDHDDGTALQYVTVCLQSYFEALSPH